MTFRHFLIVMCTATLTVWAAWMYVIVNIDPTVTGAPGFIFFYLTLAVAIVGTLTILGTAVRRIFRRDDLISRQVAVSFRQSVLLALLLMAALMLMGKNLLNGWNIFLLITALSFLELAFLASRRQRPHP